MGDEPHEPANSPDDEPIDLVLTPGTRDLGDGFTVKRALPSARRRMIGPFIFLDQMGPAVFRSAQGLDVRPHPHIGLSTLTYLFEGEVLHRDSLGTVQAIRPGDVNWMTAGRGIVHSERTPNERRVEGERLYGIQCWLALPQPFEETDPTFVHLPATRLPDVQSEGVRMRLVAGEFLGERSPLGVYGDTLYADVSLDAGATFSIPARHEERGMYLTEGELEIDGNAYAAGQLLILRERAHVSMVARNASRFILLGGDRADGPRHIWWNFVSSSKERLEQAKSEWREGAFPNVPGETEFIPLPDEPPPKVRYP